MSFRSKSQRRQNNVVCSVATKKTVEPTSTIAMQEEAMWDAYRREQQSISHSSIEETPSKIVKEISSQDSDVTSMETFESECEPESGSSRFEVTTSGPPHMYPTGKKGRTTKDRRYCPATKKSDKNKIHGKLKGRSYSQEKKSGSSMNIKDFD